MNLFDVFPLTYSGLALALSGGMLVVGRNAIRRIRRLGYADPATLWRLGMIRVLTATIVLLGLVVAVSLFLVQIDVWIGLFGSADDTIGIAIFAACLAWYVNAMLLGYFIDTKRDRLS